MGRFLPFLIIDVMVVLVGYFLTVYWLRFTNTRMDENGKLDGTANAFFIKMWGGIGLFGVTCYFLTK